MTDFKVGDRVKVEFEGEVIDAPDYDTRVVIRSDTGSRWRVHPENFTVVEPEYEEGAMYVDADGAFFVYWPGLNGDDRPWFEPGREEGCARSYPTLPLVKLVREAA